MTLLALDLGTRTGWALATNPLAYGYSDFRPGRYEGGGMRFLRFTRFLDDLCKSTPITEVAYEEVRAHAGVDAAHVYGGLMAHLQSWCEEHAIPYQGYPVGTIKRFATGRGNAPKSAMLDAVAKLGYPVQDDNVADAICILMLARSSQ